MTALTFLILAFAVHRATHLVVEDQFPPVAAFRGWVERRFGEDSSPAYLVGCFWCSSVWVSAAAVGLLYLFTPAGWHGVPMPLALGAALSTAATLVETVVEFLDNAAGAVDVGGGD